MSIAVSVLTAGCVARNNDGAARQTNDQREFSEAKATRSRQLHIVSTPPRLQRGGNDLSFLTIFQQIHFEDDTGFI